MMKTKGLMKMRTKLIESYVLLVIRYICTTEIEQAPILSLADHRKFNPSTIKYALYFPFFIK